MYMKKGGGKRKGSAFQLKVAKELSKWYGKDKSFNNSPGSGAWSTIHDSNKVPGDIVCPDDFPFVIECKKQEAFSLYKMFDREYKLFNSFWEQVCTDATRVGKKPLLIIGKNHNPTLVCCRIYELPFEKISSTDRYMVLLENDNTAPFKQVGKLILMLFSDFLNSWTTYKWGTALENET